MGKGFICLKCSGTDRWYADFYPLYAKCHFKIIWLESGFDLFIFGKNFACKQCRACWKHGIHS